MLRIFQQIQKMCAIYGMASNQHPFNLRNWLALSIFGIGIILNGVHFACEAKTFQEFVDSIFVATMFTGVLAIFAFIVLNMRQIFDFISEAEQIIDDSELYLLIKSQSQS